jgi:hypothetical protein
LAGSATVARTTKKAAGMGDLRGTARGSGQLAWQLAADRLVKLCKLVC